MILEFVLFILQPSWFSRQTGETCSASATSAQVRNTCIVTEQTDYRVFGYRFVISAGLDYIQYLRVLTLKEQLYFPIQTS